MSEVPLDSRWERAPESPVRVQSDAGHMFVGILTTSTRPFSSLRWLTRPERVNQRQFTSPGWAVVSWLGLGLGWCMADRALCERVRTGTLWNVPASLPPKSPVVPPGRGFPSFVVPLGQVNGWDTRVRVAVESRRAKEGPSFFMRRRK